MENDHSGSLIDWGATQGESEVVPQANQFETRQDENISEGKFDAVMDFIDSESDEDQGRQNPLGKDFGQVDLSKVKEYFESSNEKVTPVEVSVARL